MPPAASPSAPLCQAQGLTYTPPGRPMPLFAGLDFEFGPGLALILGGEGRGKTTLLRLLAGMLAPTSGSLRRPDTVWAEDALDPAQDALPAAEWLASAALRHPGWQPGRVAPLVQAFALDEHLPKPLYMLSAGSRRKLGLVGAAASDAALTLLDMPCAALDGRSIRVLGALLAEAAAGRTRAWVVADYLPPPGLDGLPLAARIELGD